MKTKYLIIPFLLFSLSSCDWLGGGSGSSSIDPRTVSDPSPDDDDSEEVDPYTTAVYSIKSGTQSVTDWVLDSDINESKRYFENTQVQWVGAFGVGGSVVPGPLSRGSSVGTDIPDDVLEDYREDKLNASGHSPGLVYRFNLPNGDYRLRVIYVKSSESGSFVVNINGTDAETITTAATTTATAELEKIDFSVSSSEETKIILYPSTGFDAVRIAGVQVMSVEEPVFPSPSALNTRYIKPVATGAGTGLSWADAAALSSISALMTSLKDNGGGEILLHSGLGSYTVTARIEMIKTTASAGEPQVIIRGVNPDSPSTYQRAVIESNRTSPWPYVSTLPGGGTTAGSAIFNLRDGMDNLVFRDLSFRNIGGGGIKIADTISDLEIYDIDAENSQRVIENLLTGAIATAPVNNLTIKYVAAKGYGRNLIRLQYTSSNVLIEDVFADSENNIDSTGFSTGVVLEASASNVTMRRMTSLNHYDESNAYWNADGFSAENLNTQIRFEYTLAAGNTDGGYDVKSADTVFLHPIGIDNKKNFRLWNSATLSYPVSLNPNLRGGSGYQAHLGSYVESQFPGQNKLIVLDNIRFSDSSTNTLVFETLDFGGTSVSASSGTIDYSSSATLTDGVVDLDASVVVNQN